MIAGAIFEVVKSVLGLGAGALERRARLKEIKLESQAKVEVARAEAEISRLNKLIDAEANWDAEAVRQMSTSWKDEYLTILLSLPMIIAFLGPWGRQTVSEGFDAIANAPEWYKVAFLVTIAASFGIRTIVNRFGLGKK
jgi:hypothetical protein